MTHDDAEPATDVLGEPWLAETIPLADDEEGEVVATLVRHGSPTGTGRAVLHVHGFADYFFQTEYAAWWRERGYDVYGLDLRKYGRSLREHHTPTYVADLATYDEEIEEAWRRVVERDGHDHVVVSAHSTGGLTMPLWAQRRRPEALAALVLNSPWLDLKGSLLLRTLGTRVADELGRRRPHHVVRKAVTGLYTRSLHRDHDGEWDFDLAWKPVQSFVVRAGWFRAIRRGHATLHRGLDVDVPVLVLHSSRSSSPTAPGEDVDSTDIVLDVRQMRQWATAIGPHVTCVAIEGARHDVVLSQPVPRARVYDELDRWCRAYLD